MKLTLSNYFTHDNNYLTASKLKDYSRDPWLFYRKHVLHDLVEPQSPSMLVGSAIDAWATRGMSAFNKEYTTVKRRTLKESSPSGKIELTAAQWETVYACCTEIEKHDVYKDIVARNFQSQQILQVEESIGQWTGTAGIPDWSHVDKNGAIICDLKTTSNLDKFQYTAADLGYHFSQAFYQRLLRKVHHYEGEITTYLLVVETDSNYPRCALYKLSPAMLALEDDRITGLLAELAKRTDWPKPNLNWKDATTL
jgi:hypothetical protein